MKGVERKERGEDGKGGEGRGKERGGREEEEETKSRNTLPSIPTNEKTGRGFELEQLKGKMEVSWTYVENK